MCEGHTSNTPAYWPPACWDLSLQVLVRTYPTHKTLQALYKTYSNLSAQPDSAHLAPGSCQVSPPSTYPSQASDLPPTPGLDQDTHPGYQPRPLCPPNFIPPKPYPIFRINPTCISCILFQLALSISNTDKRSPHNRSLSKNTNNIKDQNSILLSHLNPPVL